MPERAVREDWVRIHQVLLEPAERAPNLPKETRATPLQVWVCGHLLSDSAALGDHVSIRTPIGRELEGELVTIWPRYDHDFGEPQPELLAAARRFQEV